MTYTLVTDIPTFPAQTPLNKIALTSNITLSWAVSFASNTVIAYVNRVIPDQNGWSITLDNATFGAEGTELRFLNRSIYSFNILNHSGDQISNVLAGQSISILLYDNSTSDGLWDVSPYGGEFNSISNFEITSSDQSIVITDGEVNPPGNEVDLKLNTSVSNITKIDNTGFVVVTDTDPLQWETTPLVGGSNIDVDGNIINLESNVVGLTNFNVGNVFITGDTIATSAPDQDIVIFTEGDGVISLNGLNIDSNGVLANSGDRVLALFTDTITGLTNTIVIESSTNAYSVTGSSGTYKITFTTTFPDTNYGVFFGFGSTGEPIPPSYKATWLVRETTFVTINIKDDSGELVTDLPNGVIVEVKNK